MGEGAFAAELVSDPSAYSRGAITPLDGTGALTEAFVEAAFVLITVGEVINALAMLNLVQPFALVNVTVTHSQRAIALTLV